MFHCWIICKCSTPTLPSTEAQSHMTLPCDWVLPSLAVPLKLIGPALKFTNTCMTGYKLMNTLVKLDFRMHISSFDIFHQSCAVFFYFLNVLRLSQTDDAAESPLQAAAGKLTEVWTWQNYMHKCTLNNFLNAFYLTEIKTPNQLIVWFLVICKPVKVSGQWEEWL